MFAFKGHDSTYRINFYESGSLFCWTPRTDECAYGIIGRGIWYFVHHTPIHLWGGGPRWGYWIANMKKSCSVEPFEQKKGQ